MISIKSMGIAALCLVITACASAPQPKRASATAALPSGAPTPNPYLQSNVTPSPHAAQFFAAAVAAMEKKQWAQAETLLHKVIADNNQLSGAHLNLGLVRLAQQDKPGAEQAFVHAIAANDTNLDAYNQLAILKREAGDFAAAERYYLKALDVWVFHPDSHKNIAILYDLYLGKSAEALPHYEAYLALRGGADKQAASWIADLQRRLGVTAKSKPEPELKTETETETETEIKTESSPNTPETPAEGQHRE